MKRAAHRWTGQRHRARQAPAAQKVRLDFTSVYNNSDRFYKTRKDRPQASVQARHRHNVESTREASRCRAWRRIDASAAQRRCGSSLECRSRTSHPCLGYHTILPYPLRQRDSTGRCVRENERRCTRRQSSQRVLGSPVATYASMIGSVRSANVTDVTSTKETTCGSAVPSSGGYTSAHPVATS